MIFDNYVAEALYEDYALRGDVVALDKLQLLSTSLIEVIALSVCPDQFDDLVQEGHLKVRQLVLNISFDPSRGSLYSFLSSSLRNHMTDVIRKEHKQSHDGIEDNEGATSDVLCVELNNDDLPRILDYSEHRFPSIHSSISRDVALYSATSAGEYVPEGCRGIIRTICTVYNLDRALARSIYFSTLIVLRMCSVSHDWLCNVEDALKMITCREVEVSLIPEVCLVMGKEQAKDVCSIFAGSYVKF